MSKKTNDVETVSYKSDWTEYRSEYYDNAAFDSAADVDLASQRKLRQEDSERDTWAKKIDFAFSIAGGFVGLGNVWRFPYLCFKNGGGEDENRILSTTYNFLTIAGAFLIPYILFVAIGSLPVFFLEVTIGQYARCGSALAWMIVPVFKGMKT